MTSFLGVVRVLLLSLLISAAVAQECPVPFVRLEWRQFTPTQRAAWIEAVNVHIRDSPAAHDADRRLLVPRQPPSRSQLDAVCPGQ